MPRISGKKLVKKLSKIGFEPIRQSGSHIILKKEKKAIVVPNHKEIDRGTLLSIIRQAGLKRDEFLKLK